ncbi:MULTISPECIES: SDR family NAD(P)-dependent oxidoreductase [Vibrio]|uniref:SDR family NAD(P)-dependent oxidoreductase n=1 Tax=Vibrio TaxID=662 RepID=UPI00097E9084|nr:MULTISPECIES: SDR family NAD(P)-dependent oxidoreductase [Vibrio]SJN16710.1 Oxidoreductase, short-chain dehydrogenase/reductase family [Vibrio casei]
MNNIPTVLITGASSGIGRSLALVYAQAGYQVFAGGRSQERLSEICSQHSNIETLICDLTEPEALKAASINLPNLDVLILNAGTCEYIDDAKQFDGELFARVINANLTSVGYCLDAWLPLVKSGGNLAITSSSAAFLPLPRAEAYGASKAALTYLARTLSIDLKPNNIHVSVIHPGFVKTPLTDKNSFPMPFLTSTEEAAQAIFKGIKLNKSDIHFPRIFTWLLKTLSLLPFPCWKILASRITH